jgi:serine/threonine protein kinase
MSPVSDIYSLGCTLYYAVTGKVPFPGGTTRDKARRHCEEIPLNPRRFNLELTDEFIDVIAAMMEKEPTKRLQSGGDVVRRLAPWAKESVVGAVREVVQPVLPVERAALSQSDTQPGWFEDLGPTSDDSSSQVTQRTDAVASADHDTLPDIDLPDLMPKEAEFPLVLSVLVLGPLLLAAGVLVVSVAIKALL